MQPASLRDSDSVARSLTFKTASLTLCDADPEPDIRRQDLKSRSRISSARLHLFDLTSVSSQPRSYIWMPLLRDFKLKDASMLVPIC
ncbi:hypothetical protein PILCRDRAFT_810494 [Piloderma croceum F 1598]|uniref:Uncharacterized protein n=1 Tax=Piloderma croceum (strain F 1598) TaxID=765440 RepID=A0A0C3CRY2_PILCF|nr:hypothetical protein PILCRDRAFT_810494 [Piloderma croceum F 1598]